MGPVYLKFRPGEKWAHGSSLFSAARVGSTCSCADHTSVVAETCTTLNRCLSWLLFSSRKTFSLMLIVMQRDDLILCTVH